MLNEGKKPNKKHDGKLFSKSQSLAFVTYQNFYRHRLNWTIELQSSHISMYRFIITWLPFCLFLFDFSSRLLLLKIQLCDCINRQKTVFPPCNQYAKWLHCFTRIHKMWLGWCGINWYTKCVYGRKWKEIDEMPKLTHANESNSNNNSNNDDGGKTNKNCTVVNWFWCDVMWSDAFSILSAWNVICEMVYDLNIVFSLLFVSALNGLYSSVRTSNCTRSSKKKLLSLSAFPSPFLTCDRFHLREWIFKWRNNNIMICTIDFILLHCACIVLVVFAIVFCIYQPTISHPPNCECAWVRDNAHRARRIFGTNKWICVTVDFIQKKCLSWQLLLDLKHDER